MKTKLFPVITDIINLILLYMIVIGAFSIIVVGMEMPLGPYDYMSMAAVILCFYLLREFATSLKFYAPGNLIVFITAIYFAPDFDARLRVGFVTFIFMILNAHFWIEHDGNSAMDIHWGAFPIFVALSGYASSKGHMDIVTRLFYFTVVFIALEIVKQLLKNAYDLSLSGQLTSDMPVKEIYRNSFFAAAAIVFSCIAIMMFVRADWLINFLNGILHKIEYVILYVFMFLIMSYEEDELEITEQVQWNTAMETEQGGIIDQILNIVGALIVLLILIGITILIIKGIRNLIRDYGTRDKRVRKGRVYKKDNEIRESIVRTKEAKEPGFFGRKTNEEKIRYMYKRKMLSYLKRGTPISGTHTPMENAGLIYESSSKDATVVTRIYEKIRYSGQEVSDDDVAAMKSSIKNI